MKAPKVNGELRATLRDASIIPAVRKLDLLDRALASHSKLIYLLCGDPESIEQVLGRILDAGKLPFVNIDLISGLSRDQHALNYLFKRGAKGVISTHGETVRQARCLGLYGVQRTFLLDSGAMENICHQMRNHPTDAIEVLPAVAAPKLARRINSDLPDIPLVGGGLIDSLREVEDLLGRGLSAVSISEPELWIA